jgi:hypothetical protein
MISAVLLYLQAVRTRFQLHKSITPDGCCLLFIYMLTNFCVCVLMSTACACRLDYDMPGYCCLLAMLTNCTSETFKCVCLQAVRTRFQLHKSITPDYYGFRDEEDGVLLAVEAEAEATIQAQVGSIQGIKLWHDRA